MTSVSDPSECVSPLLTAALLLAGNDAARRLDLLHPTVDDILEATGATRSRAYELRDAIIEQLPALQRASGRPATTRVLDPHADHISAAMTLAMLRFVMAHPGCVHAIEARRAVYRDAFRRKVVELRIEHESLPLARFAQAVNVPLDTIEEWLRSDPVASTDTVPATPDAASNPVAARGPMGAHIETVLSEWKNWHGAFTDFCAHVHENCRIPFRHTLIGNILHEHGVRKRAKRGGRSPDERALRGSFETFFPDAQWVGDGSPIAIELQGVKHTFNVELMIDPYSGAFVGATVTDQEDSAAVASAFNDAKLTTDNAPLAVLLDNKPSNHTGEVDAALGETIRMRATPKRPQNKAHCEGAFGLFQQTVPALVLSGATLRELARTILTLVVITFGRAINHRPRRDRDGHSRVELHDDTPTPEQVEVARAALTERCRLQDLARKTLEARQRPEVRAYLDEIFVRLALLDPQRSVRIAIARYPFDAIVDGVAIFDAMSAATTLPGAADARYLLGIVRNVSAKIEGTIITDALLRERIAMRDRLLADLISRHGRILDSSRETATHLRDLVQQATDAERWIDRQYWLLAIVELIRAQPECEHPVLVRSVSLRIHATFRITTHHRADAVRYVVDRVVPLN